MTIKQPILAGVSVLTFCAAPLALAQQGTINDYVRGTIAEMAGVDSRLIGEIRLDELELDESAEFVFDIDPEKMYFVYGACDDDCYDIDLYAHDASEEAIDADEEEDAAPYLVIMPGAAADELHVVVGLADCETDTCVVGVGLYEAID